MEEIILISYLNDFIFCPMSIYFHKLYGNMEKELYQREYQINGTDAHKTIDTQKYSTSIDILQGIDVFSDKYGIEGKIDLYYIKKGLLVERKNRIIEIYDGYIYQIYAQYYALKEMGYDVKKLKIYSISDNKNYYIKLPEQDIAMKEKFEKLLQDIREFDMNSFEQENSKKCEKCIYEPSCDRSKMC